MSSQLDPDVRELLRAYLDAVALSEPIQNRIWQSAQLTLTQVRTLRRLGHGPMSPGQLGRDLRLSPTSMTRILDRLEERGLVERRRDAQDRRRVLVSPLEAADRLLGETPLLEDSDIRRAVERLDPNRRQAITGALRDLVKEVRELEPDSAERIRLEAEAEVPEQGMAARATEGGRR
jgi:DNA-binding MarR family transcriptional regulator